jgi:RNA-directed DNA polymerase
MDVKRQQVGGDQLFLSWERPASSCHGASGKGGTQAAACEVPQASTAWDPARALTEHLMEEVCQRENLNQAYRRVKSNKGAPGVDGMTIQDLAGWITQHKEELIASLTEGSYQPQPVRRVDIPKAGGGMRQLGIPTVVDRLVQQAILQVLEPLLDPTFSASSYGFRPGRGAHDALAAASQYVADGRAIVVDLDLEKFFDRVNHDILMARLARRITDKRLLRIVRRFLRTGMMHEGLCVERYEGTPQGGPLTPPTMLHNCPVGAFGLRRWAEAVDDANVLPVDFHALHQRADQFPASGPVGLLNAVSNSAGELPQLADDQAQLLFLRSILA